MVFKRAEALRSISEGLAWVQLTCEQQGLLKLCDNHTMAQHFFCRLLNAAFGLQLIEMDRIQANYPAIDLGDKTNGVAYQITTERRGEKMQSTLDQFVAHGLDQHYDVVKILVIGERQTAYKALNVPPSLRFDPASDILGIPELVKCLGMLGTEHLAAVQAVFSEELKGTWAIGQKAKPDKPPMPLAIRLETVNLKGVEVGGQDVADIVLRARFHVTNQSGEIVKIWKVKCEVLPYKGHLAERYKQPTTPNANVPILPGETERQNVEFRFRVLRCDQPPLLFALRSLVSSELRYWTISESATGEPQCVVVSQVADSELIQNITTNLRNSWM